MPQLESGAAANQQFELSSVTQPPPVIHAFASAESFAVQGSIDQTMLRFDKGGGTGSSRGSDHGVGSAAEGNPENVASDGPFPNQEDDKVVIIIEKRPGTRYLEILQRRYPKAAFILALSGRGDYSPSPHEALSDPLQRLGGITVVDRQRFQSLIGQDAEVRIPDAISDDLYAGLYWAIQHGSKSAILISNFQDGNTLSATEAVVAKMRDAHIRLFVVSGHTTPYVDLINYANANGGKSIINGPFYGSPDWDSYTRSTGVFSR